MSALILAIVALPMIGGLLCAASGPRLEDGAGRVGAGFAAVALALTVLVTVHILSAGPVSAVLTNSAGDATLGLYADRLSVVMLLLVLTVSLMVQLFASRYLSGDPRQARLIAWFGVTTAAVCALVCAATLSGLIAAWLFSGIGLLRLLAQRRDLPAARLGLRRTAAAFAVGDCALLAAGVLAWCTVGDLDLRRLHAATLALGRHHVLGIGAGTIVACLIVVAAMGRSAQLPLQRWLPATLAAPTPVSAFLHAGLVNAGGFLLVRFAPLFGATPAATYLAFTVGGATALYGTVLMLAKPDVKGALAHSTMGQMGFMVMACGLGVPAAAIFHLAGHGLYKATLFLGADSVVHNDKRRRVVPAPAPAGVRWTGTARAFAAALVPGAALALALATFASGALAHPGAVVLFAFAWATGALLAHGWLRATPGRAAGGLLVLGGACLAYAGLIAGADAFLAPAVHGVRAAVSPWLGLLPVGGMAVWLVMARRVEWARAELYVRALDAGHVGGPRSAPIPRAAGGRRVALPLPVLRPREQVRA